MIRSDTILSGIPWCLKTFSKNLFSTSMAVSIYLIFIKFSLIVNLSTQVYIELQPSIVLGSETIHYVANDPHICFSAFTENWDLLESSRYISYIADTSNIRKHIFSHIGSYVSNGNFPFVPVSLQNLNELQA